ncbi:UDP-N-acetylmuramoyl-L-alanyl-D-glutamate--2,6-diaminopimelate ligase [Terribacillus saccharophilus]|uniref:UDP-N-acetylmuramoyl-L-alanyl-D-glutamate--2, 6-diaminopimelate ligase n=1 Tax=Terribacillus saccharophilus TaxID=361277 RepID=UPI00381C6BF2
MKVSELLQGLIKKENLFMYEYLDVSGITDSSLEVKRGDMFIAIKGNTSDGHFFIDDAVAKGATIIIGKEQLDNLPIPYVQISNTRKALGIISKRFFKEPAKNKILIGITGTNGKTTTSYLVKHILENNGYSCSLIGTIKNIVNGKTVPSVNTTPSSLLLNKILSESEDQVVVMEVSSHGLAQDRVEGIEFDFCLFTNLTHEHLDYHGTMEQYFETKALLFEKLKPGGTAIINVDNFYGEKLRDRLKAQGKRVITIGADQTADLVIAKESFGQYALIIESNISFELQSSIPGLHNLYNGLMAYAVAFQFCSNRNDILSSIKHFSGVPGRFKTFHTQEGVTVVVDYAHTADAFFYCLTAAKKRGAKRVTHVFGFRGGRDGSKRAEMMSVSAELSDLFVLTLDDLNGVSEDKMFHTLHHLNHSIGNGKGLVISDRTEAIRIALENSRRGDWLLITGKGHEDYEEIHNFALGTSSDIDSVQTLLKLHES